MNKVTLIFKKSKITFLERLLFKSMQTELMNMNIVMNMGEKILDIVESSSPSLSHSYSLDAITNPLEGGRAYTPSDVVGVTPFQSSTNKAHIASKKFPFLQSDDTRTTANNTTTTVQL